LKWLKGGLIWLKKEKIQFINGYIIGFFISGIIFLQYLVIMGGDINARKYKKWFWKRPLGFLAESMKFYEGETI